jgi:predicted nucleic acid-binding protein
VGRVLIDTSVLVAIERGETHAADVLGGADGAVSVVSVSELLHGVFRARTPVRQRRRRAAEGLLRHLETLPITDEIARLHAELGAELASDGITVPVNDFWIGCTALVENAAVATRDRRSFSRIPGLHVIAA